MPSTRLLYWVMSEIQKRGCVKVGEPATLVDISYQYFKYSTAKQLTSTYNDIVLVKENRVKCPVQVQGD